MVGDVVRVGRENEGVKEMVFVSRVGITEVEEKGRGGFYLRRNLL